MILLGELFDDLVNELSEGDRAVLARLSTLVQQLKELAQVLLAVLVRVRLVNQTQGADEYFQTLLNRLLLKSFVEEEFLQHPDGRKTEVAVA